MIFGVTVFDPQTVFGVAGLVFTILLPVIAAVVLRKTQGESRWRSAAEAESERADALASRVSEAKEEIGACRATIEERSRVEELLRETLASREDQIAHLLERTPEKLWEETRRLVTLLEGRTVIFEVQNAKLDTIVEILKGTHEETKRAAGAVENAAGELRAARTNGE